MSGQKHRLTGWLYWLADHERVGITAFVAIVAVYAGALCIP